MSRHTLGDSTPKRRRFICGYDRNQDRFFLQVWGPRSSAPVHIDFDLDLDDLEGYGALVPEGFRDQIRNEVLGSSDTNICKDWRQTAKEHVSGCT